jgi:CelD/BcsL family acetyltransferase involved in cellulose biosynthesis
MQVEVFSKPSDLESLRESWDRIYERDPEAHFFVSRTHLSRYMRLFDGAWFILAARPTADSEYVALFPLRLRTKMDAKTGHFYNEINMAGNYASDYTGLICDPRFAEPAIVAFAKYLKKMHWARIHLENIRMSEARLRLLMAQFSGVTFGIQEISRVNKIDNVDNRKCVSIDLPASWEAYLEGNLGSNTRQKLRRFLRKVEGSQEFRIANADETTIARDVEILLQLWRQKWGERKGRRLPVILSHSRKVMRDNFASGSLFMPILWQGDKPIGALAIFVDPVKKAMLFFMAARDESVTNLPVGLVLHGYSIRHAIEQGFKTYDFLRGDEPYKYAFGVRESTIYCGQLYTRTGLNLGNQLDARSLGGVLGKATEYHKAGSFEAAQAAYLQILQVDPNHRRTLYQLAQLLTKSGAHRQAAEVLEKLSALSPASVKIWLRLGFALKAAGQFAEAISAFEKAMQLSPGLTIAKFGIGQSLLQQWRIDEAAAELRSILRQPATNANDRLLRKRAWLLLQKLTREEPSIIPRSDHLNRTIAQLKSSAWTAPRSPEPLATARG